MAKCTDISTCKPFLKAAKLGNGQCEKCGDNIDRIMKEKTFLTSALDQIIERIALKVDHSDTQQVVNGVINEAQDYRRRIENILGVEVSLAEAHMHITCRLLHNIVPLLEKDKT